MSSKGAAGGHPSGAPPALEYILGKWSFVGVDEDVWGKAQSCFENMKSFPERDAGLSAMTRFQSCYNPLELLQHHMEKHARTKTEAILDVLLHACRKLGNYRGWYPSMGCSPFPYDAFGGKGYDYLFVKKSDPGFFLLRFLLRELNLETGAPPPEEIKTAICAATAGLLFATAINPKIQVDYASMKYWRSDPMKLGGPQYPWSDNDDHWDIEPDGQSAGAGQSPTPKEKLWWMGFPANATTFSDHHLGTGAGSGRHY